MADPGKLIIGVSLGLTLWGLYKTHSQQQSNTKQVSKMQQQLIQSQSQNHLSITKILQKKMKQMTIDTNSFQSCKQAAFLIFNYTLHNVMITNRELKQMRNSMKRQTTDDMQKYLRVLLDGAENANNVSKNSKKQAYNFMKTNGQCFNKYSHELNIFKHQLRKNYINSLPGILCMSLDQTKKILQILIGYLESNIEKLTNLICVSTSSWSHPDKQKLLTIISIVIIDQSIGSILPHIDQVQVQFAKKKWEKQLSFQLQKLRQLQILFWQHLISEMRKNM